MPRCVWIIAALKIAHIARILPTPILPTWWITPMAMSAHFAKQIRRDGFAEKNLHPRVAIGSLPNNSPVKINFLFRVALMRSLKVNNLQRSLWTLGFERQSLYYKSVSDCKLTCNALQLQLNPPRGRDVVRGGSINTFHASSQHHASYFMHPASIMHRVSCIWG